MNTPRAVAAAFVVTLMLVQTVGAQQAPDVSQLALPEGPVQTNATPRTLGLGGDVQVVVRLSDVPLAAAHGRNAKKAGGRLSPAQQRDYLVQLDQKQDTLLAHIRNLGGRDPAKLSKALNAVVVTIPASQVPAVAVLPGVLTVRPLHDYRLDLSETVPYIGATAVQNAGVNGTGVRVAVLDTGIDYTHRFFGGPGTAAAYAGAYGTSTTDPRNTTTDGLFPTGKVVGGFDFVGEKWPNGPLMPDPDPIDCGPSAIPAPCNGGHGTHVADIIAGNDGGSHKGVAPGASLYAVKVCSAVSSSCSGVALIEGIDFALDPNGDGDISDAVDVVNMSLGAAYGQKEDDLSAASANAVNLGVIVVAGAGFTSKEVAFVGRGCPGDPYLADPSGKVALIDRGVCAVSLKVNRAAKAGAVGVLIGLVASGDAISFSFGGGDTFVPTLVITQSTSNLIKANISAPVVVTVSPSTAIPLVGSMVSSSARGPSISYQAVKPDIGAPGASVSAVAGSGTGQEAFGGTSGATPMIAGSAALLLNAYPSRTPSEIKSLLMNTAETNITTNPALQPGVLAPISRIGGGEVRVDRALNSTTAAWDDDD